MSLLNMSRLPLPTNPERIALPCETGDKPGNHSQEPDMNVTQSNQTLGKLCSDRLFRASLVGKIFLGEYGYNCTHNYFCVVVEETPKTAILAPIRTRLVSGKFYEGTERPVVPTQILTERSNFRAKKIVDSDGTVGFQYRRNRYGLWDGEDKSFNSD